MGILDRGLPRNFCQLALHFIHILGGNPSKQAMDLLEAFHGHVLDQQPLGHYYPAALLVRHHQEAAEEVLAEHNIKSRLLQQRHGCADPIDDSGSIRGWLWGLVRAAPHHSPCSWRAARLNPTVHCAFSLRVGGSNVLELVEHLIYLLHKLHVAAATLLIPAGGLLQ